MLGLDMTGMANMYGKMGAVLLAGVVLALSGGCGMEQRVVAHRTETNKQWFGDMGITGHLNKVRVDAGSRVEKMSIIGDGNEVYVEDNVTLSKIEIFGERNVVSIPERLVVRDSIVGKGNTIERRPREIDNTRTPKTREMSVPEHTAPSETGAQPAVEPAPAPTGTGGGE